LIKQKTRSEKNIDLCTKGGEGGWGGTTSVSRGTTDPGKHNLPRKTSGRMPHIRQQERGGPAPGRYHHANGQEQTMGHEKKTRVKQTITGGLGVKRQGTPRKGGAGLARKINTKPEQFGREAPNNKPLTRIPTQPGGGGKRNKKDQITGPDLYVVDRLFITGKRPRGGRPETGGTP